MLLTLLRVQHVFRIINCINQYVSNAISKNAPNVNKPTFARYVQVILHYLKMSVSNVVSLTVRPALAEIIAELVRLLHPLYYQTQMVMFAFSARLTIV